MSAYKDVSVPSSQPVKSYASSKEVEHALATMSSADRARLRHSAQLRSLGLTGVDWEDLISEATTRALSGVRRWPRDVPFIAFMIQTIRSIASEEWQQRLFLAEDLDSDPSSGTDTQSSHVVPDLATDMVTPERVAQAHSALGEIESIFSGDDEALSIIRGLALGHTPEETQKEANLSSVSYASAQRRIRRVLAKHLATRRQV